MPMPRYRFRPRLGASIAAAVGLVVFIGLGFWQIERAQTKRALLERLRTEINAEPVALQDASTPSDIAVPRAASAVGRFDREHQLLLDNQLRDGRAGYRVLTPLRLAGRGLAVLVDRGWIAAPPSREQVPNPDVPGGRQRISGITGYGPSVALRMGPTYAGNGAWPRRVAYMDYDYFGEALPYPVLPYLIEPGGSDNPTIRAIAGFGPKRHIGYAVQWFLMAGAVVVLYLLANLRRRE